MVSTLYDNTYGTPFVTDLTEIAISLDPTSDPHIINLSKNTNKKFNRMTRNIEVEAVLNELTGTTLVPSSASAMITFDLKIYHDCSNHEEHDVL